jgi:protein-disulfide isomerase-like protein with CxxC motif
MAEPLPNAAPISSRAEALAASWSANDHARAFLKTDHDVIDSTSAVRALIVEHLLGRRGDPDSKPERDLFHAFGVLGRLVASRGGSPSLAAITVDGGLEVVGDAHDAAWILPARAALAEGYASTRRDLARAEATARWEFPTCAVPLHDGIIAIAAGYPDEDEDALAAWAGRVANAAVLAGTRRVVIAGPAAARAALAETLNVAGIELLSSYEAPPRPRR